MTKLSVFVARSLFNRSGECDRIRRSIFLGTMFLLIIAFHAFPPSLKASGPWKAQVVDAETKQPLQGVVVLAVWYRYWPAVEDLGAFGYVDSEEVITDKDGQFTIKARSFIPFDPFVLEEPEFHFVKPGYGRWRFQRDEGGLRLDVRDRKLPYQDAGRLGDKGTMIELVPLKTREERVQFDQSPDRTLPVPLDQTKTFERYGPIPQ